MEHHGTPPPPPPHTSVCQAFHIFTVRSRFDSVFSKNPFRNLVLNIGVLLEMAIVIIVIWVPGVNDFFEVRMGSLGQ